MRIVKIVVTLIIGLNGFIMCLGWIHIFTRNLSFVNALVNLSQQNLSIASDFLVFLSFLCTAITLWAFAWAIGKIKSLQSEIHEQDASFERPSQPPPVDKADNKIVRRMLNLLPTPIPFVKSGSVPTIVDGRAMSRRPGADQLDVKKKHLNIHIFQQIDLSKRESGSTLVRD